MISRNCKRKATDPHSKSKRMKTQIRQWFIDLLEMENLDEQFEIAAELDFPFPAESLSKDEWRIICELGELPFVF